MAVHQIWLHGEQMTLVPSFLQTIRDLTNEEKIYMADFGIELLKECCIQASKLTLSFQEIMDLKRCETFLVSVRRCIIFGSPAEIPLVVLKEPSADVDPCGFRELVAAQGYTVARLKHFRSDLVLCLHYLEEWETRWQCDVKLADVMESVRVIFDNQMLLANGLLLEPKGEWNSEYDFDHNGDSQ